MDEQPLRSVRKLGTALTLLIGGQIVLEFLSIAAYVSRISLLNRFIDGGFVSGEEAEMADTRVAAPAIAGLVVLAIAAVVWLVWQHRAQANLVRRGVPGLRFTPGWAVGWWFVPIANLVKPYQAMSELRLASADPQGWKGARAPAVMTVWWLVWVVANISSNVAFQMARAADTPEALRSADGFGVFLSLVSIVAAVLAIAVVRTITAAQESLRMPAVPPPPSPEAPVMVADLPPRPDPGAETGPNPGRGGEGR